MAELTPQHIARRDFAVTRRGYEQQQVRGFLHEVSTLVERLTREEAELRERAERAEARLAMMEEPDEATLIEVLGEETTRVLTSAREAAAEIRTKAEAAAERIIADATSEAAEIRSRAVREADALMAETRAESDSILATARGELERRSAEAEEAAAATRAAAEADAQRVREEGEAEAARLREQAAAELDAARQKGREMVAEAQAVRERVLRDLAVRRKRARQQVEKLNAGRERLLEAYEAVRRTIDEATTELHVSLVEARHAADAAARRLDEEPEPSLEELEAEAKEIAATLPPIDHGAEPADHDHDDDDSPGPFSGEVPAIGSPAAAAVAGAEGGEEADAAAASTDAPTGEGPDRGEGAVTAGAVDEPRPPIRLDDRRGKRRRKKGFEGLPPAELEVVEPPREGEGIRILAEPAVEPEQPPADGTEAADEPAAEGSGSAAAAPSEPEGATAGDPPTPEAEVDTEAVEPAQPEPAPPAEQPAASTEPEPEPEPAEPEPAATAAGDTVVEEPAAEPGAEAPAKSADDVFARLRASQADLDDTTTEAEPAADESAEPTDEATPGAPAAEEGISEVEQPEAVEDAEEPAAEEGPDAAAFAARAEALTPIEKELARRLKRALADEQNEVLDLLRRAKPKGVDDLLPTVDEHVARWRDVAAPALGGAAAAGAEWSGGAPGPVDALADELARDLTAPLRDRIDRSFAASDGNLDDVADRVRALYREWKGQRLAEATTHFAAAAYARGVFDAIAAGTPVRWVVDPEAGTCPDCDDNVLGGVVTKGEEFPTGSPCAPAHPGCHCLVLPAA